MRFPGEISQRAEKSNFFPYFFLNFYFFKITYRAYFFSVISSGLLPRTSLPHAEPGEETGDRDTLIVLSTQESKKLIEFIKGEIA